MEEKTISSNPDLAQEQTDWAIERTRMSSTRTFMSLLRTGLAIAGGGTLITTLLVRNYPDWVVGTLAGIFIIVGFTIMLGGLFRYQKISRFLEVSDAIEPIPLRLMLIATVLLQAAIIAVLILFLLG